MPDAAFIRAFIAINLPEEVRANLAQLQRHLKSALPGDGFRWTKPEQIHLTLKFLGDIAVDSVADLQAALQRACAGIAPFTLRAESLGVFPDSQRPRVVWVEARGDTAVLRSLQEQVEQATTAWREPEPRPFQAHLTLARVRKLKPPATETLRLNLREQQGEFFGSWRVARVDLMQSKLSAAGAEYFQLANFPLAGGQP